MAIRKAVKLAEAPELHGVPQVPPCPRHGTKMHYSPEKGAWKCVEIDCKMVAYPDTETGGKPIVGKGETIFVIDHDPFRVWVKSENNLLIEVTKFFDLGSMVLADEGGISMSFTLHAGDILDVSKMQAS